MRSHLLEGFSQAATACSQLLQLLKQCGASLGKDGQLRLRHLHGILQDNKDLG